MLISLLLALGCKGTSPDDTADDLDPCVPGPSPSLVVGVGELQYQDLEEAGGEAELVHGPQGGFHINVALEARQLDASTPWQASLTGFIDGEDVGHTEPWVTMRCNPAAGALQAWGLLLIWDDGQTPEVLHGRTARVEVELTDSAGTSVSASDDILINDPSL